ncbi:hypothetical protein Tco_1410077 [Tanacetum coccineum]
MPECSWWGHAGGVHIHLLPAVGLLEGTPAGLHIIMPGCSWRGHLHGTYGFHYYPGVLGGDTYDGYIVHRFHELRDTELETLIATYDIPLDLRPRLPDPNFRMINLPEGVTLFKQGDWFSFSKHGDPAPVCMEGVKYGLKLWKENSILIDRRAILFHMPWRHPDSCITDWVPTSFNQNHVDRLKAHIMKLHDISEGVLVRSGVSRV